MELSVIPTGVYNVNSLVVPVGDNKCFVVDPAGSRLTFDENKIIENLRLNGMECVEIVLTHSHFDHITGIEPLKRAFPNAKIAIHKAEFSEMQNPPGPLAIEVLHYLGSEELMAEVAKQPSAEIALQDGDDIFGWKVIHTPGHTQGSICLFNEERKVLISGDTIFDRGAYGRTDMPGGSAQEMVKSLSLLNDIIPEGTIVYPGHESYGFSFKKRPCF